MGDSVAVDVAAAVSVGVRLGVSVGVAVAVVVAVGVGGTALVVGMDPACFVSPRVEDTRCTS